MSGYMADSEKFRELRADLRDTIRQAEELMRKAFAEMLASLPPELAASLEGRGLVEELPAKLICAQFELYQSMSALADLGEQMVRQAARVMMKGQQN